MATFFCSDPHAFHGNIMKHCRRVVFMTPADRDAFLALEATRGDLHSLRMSEESIHNMNEGLAANINARVGPNDVLWCLGDWVFGGRNSLRNARWFRDRIQCRTVFLVWGNHDDRRYRDLFSATYDQVEIQVENIRMTLNHYPLLTWNGQHHGSVESPNVHLYGHVHALYERQPELCPIRDASAWAALDVGFDGHDYQVWSVDEVRERLRPRLEAFQELKRRRQLSDPFRGRGRHAGSVPT